MRNKRVIVGSCIRVLQLSLSIFHVKNAKIFRELCSIPGLHSYIPKTIIVLKEPSYKLNVKPLQTHERSPVPKNDQKLAGNGPKPPKCLFRASA